MPSQPAPVLQQIFKRFKQITQQVKSKLSSLKSVKLSRLKEISLQQALILAAIAVLLIIIIIISYLLLFVPTRISLSQLPGIGPGKDSGLYPEVTRAPSPIPRPTRGPKAIGSGRKEFRVSGGIREAPQFKPSVLDPIDPEQGAVQKIIVAAENSVPIELVQVTVKTDNKEEAVAMDLTQGTDTDGSWEGSWIVDDTYLRNYVIEIIAEAANGEQEVTLVLR